MARKIKCTCCGLEKTSTREFYASNSYFYKDVGRIPICKNCIEEKYNVIVEKFKDKKIAAMKVFQSIDVYFDEEVFNSSTSKYSDDNKWIGEYMRVINSNAKYKGKTSDDNVEVELPIVRDISDDLESEIDEDLIDKWGEGYSEKEYNRLEKRYKKYYKNYPSEKLQQQVIIMSICKLELEQEKCRIGENYQQYANLDKQISAKMAELDVIPSKQKKYGEDKNLVYGALIGVYEENDPIPEPLDIFIDVDSFKKMLDRYFIKPFKKVFGLDKNIYTSEDEINGN